MKLIGVDLGTTNSCVYYLDDSGQPQLVVDKNGNKIFPSAVWSAGPGKDWVVGHKAKARMGTQPAPVIAVKRRMGTDQSVMVGGAQATPVAVSAEILRHVRRLVEAQTGDKVGGVVVTVPAYFDVAPRRDTQLAAVQAFFDGDEDAARGKLELQLEPEAAAYAYLAGQPKEDALVLVYDLGGGTFDVTVLKKSVREGLTPIAFGGDPHLGGDNIDDRLASWLAYRLRGGRPEALERILRSDRYDPELRYTILQLLLTNDRARLDSFGLKAEDRDLLIPDPPIFDFGLDATNPRDLERIQKLKWLAEQAKIDLTTKPEVAIVRAGIFQDEAGEIVDVDLDLGRHEFDLLVGDFIERTLQATRSVVEKSTRALAEFDCVVLVGGSSRMPVVRQKLEQEFRCPVLLLNDLADRIVAQGAALLAASLGSGEHTAGLELDYPRFTSDPVVTISGRLLRHSAGAVAYLTGVPCDERGDRDQFEAPLEDGRFAFRQVRLPSPGQNRFRLEVLEDGPDPLADQEIVITRKDTGGAGHATPRLAKPIRYLTRKGLKDFFPEGELLPASRDVQCERGDRSDFVLISIFEGERLLRDLRIENVPTDVPVGAKIKLTMTINNDYSVQSTAVVENTGTRASVDFAIEPIRIPPLAELDADKDRVVAAILEGLVVLSDPNRKAAFRRQIRGLESEYAKARTANEPDAHHLFVLIGKLRKLRIEVDRSQDFMEPPFDEFERRIQTCRALLAKLADNPALPAEAINEKIRTLEAAGGEAWTRELRREWEQVNTETGRLIAELKAALDGGESRMTPVQFHDGLLQWLDEIRRDIERCYLVARRDGESEAGARARTQRGEDWLPQIDSIKAEVRAVDLSDEKTALQRLFHLRDAKVRPLDRDVKEGLDADGVPRS